MCHVWDYPIGRIGRDHAGSIEDRQDKCVDARLGKQYPYLPTNRYYSYFSSSLLTVLTAHKSTGRLIKDLLGSRAA